MRDNCGARVCAAAWASVGWVCSRVLPLIDRELAEHPDRKRHAMNRLAGRAKRVTNSRSLAALQTRRSSRVPARVAQRAVPCRMQSEIEFARRDRLDLSRVAETWPAWCRSATAAREFLRRPWRGAPASRSARRAPD